MALYPMDVIRTKMQTDKAGGTLQVFKHTIHHGGVRALYTGIALPLTAQAVYKSTVFTVNNVTQNFILDYRTLEHQKLGLTVPVEQTLTLGDYFWCGFVGGAVNAAAFVTPVEFVRNQMIAQHSRLAAAGATAPFAASKGETYFRGSWDVIRHSVQKQGVLSLWRGTSWSIGRDGIGCGCFFYATAWAQQKLTLPGEKPSFSVIVLSGALAGLAYWVAALPMDAVKTWIQSSDVTAETLSVRDAIHKIYSEHGLVGVLQRLNRGWQVAYGRGIPSAAITITTYSLIYDHLQQVETAGKASD
jgi:solute carrier family 25 (mitochondrial carnitine/acylcarnitine transporter), member 20/29